MSHKLIAWSTAIIISLILVAIVSRTMVYVVDEREQAVVLQFGRPVKERTDPGLYFKLPFVQSVTKLPKTRQFWGGTQAFALPDLPTKDDKKIEVEPWAMWRISDPTAFVRITRTTVNAEERVAQFARSATRNVISRYDLAELVRSTSRALETSSGQIGTSDSDPTNPAKVRRVQMNIQIGREEILKRIQDEARKNLAGEAGSNADGADSNAEVVGRGIELIDLGLSQIEFVESVRIKTFDRWIAERKAISAWNTNEGEREKQEIVNQATAEVEEIIGKGKQQANQLRGAVDAEVITEYAKAIEETGEFYNFVRTLEAYENAITGDTRLILTTENDFLRLLKQLPSVESPVVAE